MIYNHFDYNDGAPFKVYSTRSNLPANENTSDVCINISKYHDTLCALRYQYAFMCVDIFIAQSWK